MSRITTQELWRSHTSPTQVNTPVPANTPIPVDTPTNPFLPTHMEPSSLQIGTEFHAQTMAEDAPPTFYPGAESSRILSHYLPKDKGKGKATSPRTLPRQPIIPEPPGGDDPDDSGDYDNNPPGGPPGGPPPPPGPLGPGIAAPTPIPHVPNVKERGNKPEPFTDVKKIQSILPRLRHLSHAE